jgi:hypothetical protein
MSNIDVVPDSRLRTIATPKGSVERNGVWWQRIFCHNCGANGGLVPEENMDFVSYLCPNVLREIRRPSQAPTRSRTTRSSREVQ